MHDAFRDLLTRKTPLQFSPVPPTTRFTCSAGRESDTVVVSLGKPSRSCISFLSDNNHCPFILLYLTTEIASWEILTRNNHTGELTTRAVTVPGKSLGPFRIGPKPSQCFYIISNGKLSIVTTVLDGNHSSSLICSIFCSFCFFLKLPLVLPSPSQA